MATIAVIDDDPGTALVIAACLQQSGHEVITGRTGLAGLEAMRRRPPDLAILDWMMPGRNGPALCQDMRSHPALRHVPVLMLTSRTLPSAQDQARAAGVDEFLTKPVVVQNLLRSVERLLAGPGHIENYVGRAASLP